MGSTRRARHLWLKRGCTLALAALSVCPAAAEAYIKSVEYVEISLGSGDTMSSVGLSKGQAIANCVPFASLMTAGVDDDFDQLFTDVYFEAGPQVTARREVSGGTVDLGVYVVEFDPSYVTVQQNVAELSFAGTSTTTGITSVDTAKAAVVFYYRGSFSSHEWQDQAVAGWFSAADTLSFERDSNVGTVYLHWYVFEAQSSEFSVQPVSLSISGTSGTASISSVAMDKSFVVGSYRNEYDGDNVRSAATVVYLNSATEVRAERNYSSSLGITDIRAFVVTLSGDANVQRGSLSYPSAGTQQTATVSSVSTNRSLVWNGMSTGPGVIRSADGSSSDVETAFHRIKLTDATTVQGDRGQASGDALYPGDGLGRFEVIDFGASALAASTGLYRSVGITATALENGTTNAMTIAGSTATFASGLPNNVGVGDAIQYDSDGNSSIDAIAFIHGRTSSTEYTVKDATGAAPVAAAGDNDWELFRAYTSLSNWVTQTENTNISAGVRDFDTSTDLVTADTTMHAACYDDGPMNDMADITGWTTGPNNYIRVFTPVLPSQVGSSQRHNGTAGTGFRLTPVASGSSYQILNIDTGYVRIEGLEIDGSGVTNALFVRGIRVRDGLSNVGDIRIDTCVIHDLHTTQDGYIYEGSMGIIDYQGADNQGPPMRVSNNIIYDITNNVDVGHIAGIHIGSRATSYVYNNTVYGIINTGGVCTPDCGPAWGIYSKAYNGGTVDVIATNNYCGSVSAVNPVQLCYDTEEVGAGLTQSFNVSSDASSADVTLRNHTAYATYFVSTTPGSEDLHLLDNSFNLWGSSGADLSADPNFAFSHDIDMAGRAVPWDIGADDVLATTAVDLVSFAARSGNGSTSLVWETGSELRNLGFHLYRSLGAEGPYQRITARVIPGLGSSPEGAGYSYRDSGLTNGVTYYYKLEDVETTGRTKLHGPVSATPQSGSEDAEGFVDGDQASLITFGDPTANGLRVVTRTRRDLVLELVTEGFYAEPLEDGTVRLHVPGFESLVDTEGPALPVKRAWVDAVAGRKVDLVSIQPRRTEAFTSLRPSSSEVSEVVLSRTGTIRARRRRASATFRGEGLSPSAAARIVSVGFQGDAKKALVELAPIRWDGARGRLKLVRRLEVRLSFREREPSEETTGRGYARRRSHDERRVLAQVVTTEKGLYGIRYENLMPGRRGFPVRNLRLSRQGETVAYHLQGSTFGPGSVLYFLSAGADANPYGREAVYELELGVAGEAMARVSAAPLGQPQPVYWHRHEWEENRYYQAALVDAPDPWLWDLLFAPETKNYPLDVSGLVSDGEASQLSVWLQGVSDFDAAPDHHVRVYVNGNLVGDASWDGKQAKHIEVPLASGILREDDNVLEIDNVGDTEAAYSMVMLDRYALEYPRVAVADEGRLHGRWSLSGTAVVSGLAAGSQVLDTSATEPRWLVDTEQGADGLVRFRAEAGRSYLAVSPDAVLHPTVRTSGASRLKSERLQADYLLIAPELFLRAVEPLLELRRAQRLTAQAVSMEQISSEFGFGETSPDAVKDFLSYAYHQWRQPSPRYVVLVGDATYDFKDYLQTGVTNQVPPRMVKTSFLWTASDPSYAAVNGDDLLADLAIGRLPAATVEEVQAMVQKIVAYETGEAGLDRAPVVLVADDPDGAGDFEADANALAAGVLAPKHPNKLFLSQLGSVATREEIVRSFDEGLSLLSYIGHGGIHLWADENVLSAADVAALDTQFQQPLLLTVNCLNGYFHFPYFDSLAEALVEAPGKGAIAAIAPSGLSLNGPASIFHQALLEELFHQNHQRLGDAVLAAQRRYAESGAFPELLSIYHLLGDPALKLR